MICMRTDYMIDNFGKNNGLTLDTILHPGDSSILAFTKRTSTILVRFDKNLGKACDFFNTNCIVIEITKKQGVTL